jgi:hypothetical protein
MTAGSPPNCAGSPSHLRISPALSPGSATRRLARHARRPAASREPDLRGIDHGNPRRLELVLDMARPFVCGQLVVVCRVRVSNERHRARGAATAGRQPRARRDAERVLRPRGAVRTSCLAALAAATQPRTGSLRRKLMRWASRYASRMARQGRSSESYPTLRRIRPLVGPIETEPTLLSPDPEYTPPPSDNVPTP